MFLLSSNGDQLSQWRAYIPKEGGYSIGFNYECMNCAVSKLGYYMLPVIYDQEVKIRFANHLFNYCVSRFKLDSTDYNVNVLSYYFYTGMCFSSYFFKHPSFSEEVEWRIIATTDTCPDLMDWGLRRSGPYLAPYVTLPVNEMLSYELRKSVKGKVFSICVGPGMDAARGTRGLAILVKRFGLPKETSVGRSITPYRMG